MKNKITTVIIMCVLLATSSATYAWDYWYSPDSFYDDDENTNSGGLLADGDEPQYGEFDPNSRWIDEVEVKYKESDWSDWGIYDDWWRTEEDEDDRFKDCDETYIDQDFYNHTFREMDYSENVWREYVSSYAWTREGIIKYYETLVRLFPKLRSLLYYLTRDYGYRNILYATEIKDIHFTWKPDPGGLNGNNNKFFESHDIKLYYDNGCTLYLKIDITSDDNAFNSLFNINGEQRDITYIFSDDEFKNATLLDNTTGIQYDFYFNQEERRCYPVDHNDGTIDDYDVTYKGKCTVVGSDGRTYSFPVEIETSIMEVLE